MKSVDKFKFTQTFREAGKMLSRKNKNKLKEIVIVSNYDMLRLGVEIRKAKRIVLVTQKWHSHVYYLSSDTTKHTRAEVYSIKNKAEAELHSAQQHIYNLRHKLKTYEGHNTSAREALKLDVLSKAARAAIKAYDINYKPAHKTVPLDRYDHIINTINKSKK